MPAAPLEKTMRAPAAAFLLIIVLPSLAAAQASTSHQRLGLGLGPIGFPLPSINTTLPPIGLGLPPIGLPQKDSVSRDRRRGPERPGRRPRFDDDRRHSRSHSTVVYVVPPPFFAPFYMDAPPPYAEPVVTTPPAPPAPAPPPTGVLELDLSAAPPAAQIFVDGFFVGTLQELSGQLRLEPGPHQIDIRAVDHQPLVFDTRIVADRSITYRGELEPLTRRAPSTKVEPKSAPATIYFIPGCYLGNVLPTASALPATCDIGKLTTHKP